MLVHGMPDDLSIYVVRPLREIDMHIPLINFPRLAQNCTEHPFNNMFWVFMMLGEFIHTEHFMVSLRSPLSRTSASTSDKSLTIQSAPASLRLLKEFVDKHAMVNIPAAFAACTPTVESSKATQCFVSNPRFLAARIQLGTHINSVQEIKSPDCIINIYPSGSGLPFEIMSAVTKDTGLSRLHWLNLCSAVNVLAPVNMPNLFLGMDAISFAEPAANATPFAFNASRRSYVAEISGVAYSGVQCFIVSSMGRPCDISII
jgi:hypothetical protein